MQEGAYRFIRNPNVSAEAIRKAGAMQTVKLAQAFPELLAIEDTTSLSYRHQVAEELGKLGAIGDKSRGWWVHSVLLLEATTFRTVGLLHQEWWMVSALESASVFPKISSSHLKSITSSLDFHHDYSRTC